MSKYSNCRIKCSKKDTTKSLPGSLSVHIDCIDVASINFHLSKRFYYISFMSSYVEQSNVRISKRMFLKKPEGNRFLAIPACVIKSSLYRNLSKCVNQDSPWPDRQLEADRYFGKRSCSFKGFKLCFEVNHFPLWVLI